MSLELNQALVSFVPGLLLLIQAEGEKLKLWSQLQEEGADFPI